MRSLLRTLCVALLPPETQLLHSPLLLVLALALVLVLLCRFLPVAVALKDGKQPCQWLDPAGWPLLAAFTEASSRSFHAWLRSHRLPSPSALHPPILPTLSTSQIPGAYLLSIADPVSGTNSRI